jgi:diketogulonate reductase-like aldo/keto reductase
MPSPMPTITLPSSEEIAVLGQGTWHLAENRARRPSEIAALRHGIDAGMKLIDTAEMYADGDAEILVGEAISGRREQVFLVSKVLPHHATRQGTPRACEASCGGSARTGWTSTCCTGAALSRSRRPPRRSWPCRRAG